MFVACAVVIDWARLAEVVARVDAVSVVFWVAVAVLDCGCGWVGVCVFWAWGGLCEVPGAVERCGARDGLEVGCEVSVESGLGFAFEGGHGSCERERGRVCWARDGDVGARAVCVDWARDAGLGWDFGAVVPRVAAAVLFPAVAFVELVR